MVALVLFAFLVMCSCSSSWNKQDTKKAIDSILSTQGQKGRWGNLQETEAAVSALQILGVTQIPKKEELCKFLQDALGKDLPSNKLHAGLVAHKKAGCTSEVPAKASEEVKKALAKGDALTTEEVLDIDFIIFFF